MVGGQVDAKLSVVLRNEQTMHAYLKETREALRSAEAHVEELKSQVTMLHTTVEQNRRDIAMLRAATLGGGPT